MDAQTAIAGLNKILSLEYSAMLQHLQHSYLVQGKERAYLRGFFRGMAEGSFKGHTKQVGEKIVALGGLPTVEPAPIRQSADVTEMLQQALEAERAAQEAQKELLAKVQDDVPLRVMLEEMIRDEQEEIEQLEMLLAQKKPVISAKVVRLTKSA
ncbi:MAG: ferritin-like domain-containing protein [Candidatus Tectomicrobia bacterium]|uniref:Ferritin-like domain-containing protein n=1 Tax=Tectimicrobiota bacterium TaxID=2528274 RepID=A0A932I2N3_UNCTE|nr:ferritin-like domain-containing protein [Candidatus Tectomicrobia bacterium]